MEIFFTSDLHFNHDKEFLWGPRGFKSSEEHDAAVIRNWNETVGNDDVVYVLGDIMMGADYELGLKKLSQLNGTIIIIKGNHDTDTKFEKYLACPNVSEETKFDTLAKIIKVGKWRFYASHRPTIVDHLQRDRHGEKESGSQKEPKSFGVHGHTHSNNKFEYIEFCCYNVSLDAHNCRPVSAAQIKEDIKKYLADMRENEI